MLITIKILYEDPKVTDKVIKMIEYEFRKMIVKCRQEHDFFRIKIKYNNNSIVTFNMKEYLLRVIEMLDEEFVLVTTPTKNNLLKYKMNLLLVNEEKERSCTLLLCYCNMCYAKEDTVCSQLHVFWH